MRRIGIIGRLHATPALPALLVLAASALLVSGCSLGHTMKTVETASKGEVRQTAGVAVSMPRVPGKAEMPIVGFLWNARHGITDRAELGYSIDGYWPGVGGKYRLLSWFAADANVKLLFPLSGSDLPEPIFDAALILGNERHSAGLKLLSHGIVPFGPAWLESAHGSDALLFYGCRFGAFMPEAFITTRHRGAGFGVGYLF